MDSSLFPSYNRLHYVHNYNRQVSSVVKHIAISARGLGFGYGTGESGHNVADDSPPLRRFYVA